MKNTTAFLPGGPSTDSPDFRHECEVRHLARMRVVERRAFLISVVAKRGQAAANRLADDVAEQFRLAHELADMETNTDRAARMREISCERGKPFAQGIRETAWELMQQGVEA